MSMVTLTGNLAADPDLKYTQQGKAVTNLTVMVNRRTKQGDQWVDANVTGWRVTCWEEMAERVAESLKRGDPVIVSGLAEERSWEQDGDKRYRIEVTARAVGLDLAKVRSGGSSVPAVRREVLPPLPDTDVPF
jgi:single-strand DNA-binding protein